MGAWVREPRPAEGGGLVAAVIDQGALTFDLAVPCEVFGVDRSDIVRPWYDFRLVAVDGRVRTSTGFVIETPYGLESLAEAETVIVPGWSDPSDQPDPRLLEALNAAYRRGARVVSLCTGAFVLAAAGLLAGRRATTHWRYADRLARVAGNATIDPQVLYVADGGVYTSAGTAAGIDLCLHLVRLDYGAAVANAVARRIVMPPYRAGGQAQYVEQATAASSNDASFSALLDWGRAHLGDRIDVPALARQGNLSVRSLRRRFEDLLGMAPSEWLRRERLRLAQQLLESNDEAVDRVAELAGYASASAMRSEFARHVLVSPRQYRQTFRQHGRAAAADQETV
jgi:transcriptional regulator GlxA family with amidase domain